MFSMMKKRNNGIDLMDKKYLSVQNEIFHALKQANIENFHFFVKPKNIAIYSTMYYTILHKHIVKTFMGIEAVNQFYLMNGNCIKNYV